MIKDSLIPKLKIMSIYDMVYRAAAVAYGYHNALRNEDNRLLCNY